MSSKTRYDRLKVQLLDLIFDDPVNTVDMDSGEIYEVHNWEMAETRLVIDYGEEEDEETEVETRIIGSHNLHQCFEIIAEELAPELREIKSKEALTSINEILNDIMATLVKDGVVRQRPEYNREQIKIVARNDIDSI